MRSIRELFGILFKSRLNRSLRILITVNTVLVFTIGIFGPFYALFIQKIGGSVAFAGLSWAIFSIVTGIFIFLFSNWGLRVKEQELLIALGYLIRGVVFISYALMTNIPQLIITQLLWGLGAALSTPAFDAVYTAHTEKENSFIEWGRWEGIAAIATGVAALVGGILIQLFGYQIIFIIMAVICFLLSLYIWLLPREIL